MNKAEILDNIALLKDEMREMVDNAEVEKRSLNDEEKSLFEQKQSNLDELKRNLADVEAAEQRDIDENKQREIKTNQKNNNHSTMTYKENIVDAVKAIANSRSVENFENVSGNTIELRATTAYADVDDMQSEERLALLEPLQNNILFDKLGIKVINTGKAVKLPSVSNVECTIEGETTQLTGQKIEFSKAGVTPYRVGVSMPFSGTAVKECDIDLIDYAFNLAGKAEAQLINTWVLAPNGLVGNDSSTAHKGAFVDHLASDSSVAGKANWEGLVGLEAKVKKANVYVDSTAAYVLSPTTEGKLKSAAVAKKDAGSGRFIIEDGKINGYPYLVSQAVVDASTGDEYIGFGVWDNLLIQRVGNPSIVVDNLSRSKENIIEVNMNDEVAVQIIRPEAFSCMKLDSSSFIA